MKPSIFSALAALICRCRLMIIVLLAGFSLDASAQGGNGMGDAIPIPLNSCYNSNFNDYQYNGYFNDYYGQPSGDIWYTFTLSTGGYMSIALCGSDFDTYVSVIDPYYNLYASNDDDWSSCGGNTSFIYQYFPAGTYFIVAEGSGYATGNIALTVESFGSGTPSAGANISYAIDAGTFGSSGSYSNTLSNADACLGNDIGQASNDIYYKFNLTSTATVTLTHCGSGFDTYMHLLDAYGNVITTNDDSSVSPCPGNQAYIQTTLSAGTYYVVSEGYSTYTGNIVTNISVSGSGGSLPAITYPTPSTFAVGAAITPLSPTNTGGAVSASGSQVSTLVSSGLSNPISTAVDDAGNIYVADAGNHSIRKITPSGSMSLLAGAGYAGYADGTGSGAVFRHPTFLAVDALGNVFVSDQQNHRIRKITPSGVVTTFAGSGSIGSSDGPGTSASFQYPMGLAFDASGNLYVADGYNHKIRKISPSGVVTTFAGTGSIGTTNGSALSSSFNYPMSVTVDASGNVYVGDRMNHMVRKISSGTVSTLAGSGSAGSANGTGTGASFNQTNGVTVDASGNIYVADQQNNMIRKINPSGTTSTLAGSTTAGSTDGSGTIALFNSPYGLSMKPQGPIYVAENTSNRVRRIVLSKGYSISPTLPVGLAFNEDTGVISGTPSGPSAATVYTVTAYNSSGSSTTTLSIEVSGSCPAPSLDQNYVITYVPREAGMTTTSAVVSASCNPYKVQTGIQYIDGLGRPLQTVQVKGSGAADKDVVVPATYDAFGREARKYLPYASTTNNGSYKTDGLTAVINYYTTGSAGQAGTFNTPFAETKFEASPLNRVLEQGAPGGVWQPASSRTTTQGRTVATDYNTNIANDVKSWTVTSSGAVAGYYAANTLYKTTVKDENWVSGNGGTTDEYKDIEGKVVLKRQWETDTKSLNTYYVYDHFSNLRYVLPPAVNENTDRNGGTAINSFVETDNVFKQFIYGYHYDGRKRMVEKKIPGKEWEYMVYNSIDQVILSQDWKQRSAGQWLFTKYDAIGNVIMTGLYADGSLRPAMQTAVDNLVVSNPNYQWWEEKSSGGVGYTNNVFPQTIAYYHSINHYGNYNFPGNVFGTPNATLGQVEEAKTKGLLTASSITVLGTGSMLLTVNYYDAEGRVIQSKSQHYKNSTADANNYDEVNNVYSFTDELKESTRKHYNNGIEALYTYNKYEYDHMGRKLSAEQKTGTNSATSNPLVKLSLNAYNEIGQLLNKSQGSTAGSSFLQSTGYTYNERGWLKTSASGLFSMELKYQEGSTAQYNGNIAQQVYNNSYDNTFNYSYDKLNRLVTSSAGNSLGESIGYDVMGNITSLSRDGYGTNNYNISSYEGNQLKLISGFTNGSYVYDDNGNLTSDGPNGNTISYNYLNLPLQVSGSQSVTYLYDASGRKLRKQSAATGITDYINGIHYKPSGGIDFVQTEEGIARNSGGSYNYEYNQTDHLGNVRLTFYKNPSNQQLEVLQRDDYYAFGKRKPVGSVGTNKYLYNGKELQEELGKANVGQFDYGARFYDPEIGRFNTIDPLGEMSRRNSLYSYALDNPIRFIDVDGLYAGEAGTFRPGDKEFENVLAYYGLDQNKSTDQEDPKKKKKEDRGSDYDNWGKKAKTAIGMFTQWLTGGLGYSNYAQYENDEIADAMRNSDGISKVREFFYRKYKNAKDLKGASVKNYDAAFGVKQLFKAGFDPIEQFVGTFKVDVYYNEESNTLEYVISNTTSMTSAFYHASPSYDTGGPMSNYYQTYKFSEPLDRGKFKKK